MTILAIYNKQPAEVKDYDIDATGWLDTDTIASIAVTADTGITIDASSIWGSSKKVKVWISGGTSGTTYKITVKMTTAGGRLEEDEFKIKVREI